MKHAELLVLNIKSNTEKPSDQLKEENGSNAKKDVQQEVELQRTKEEEKL